MCNGSTPDSDSVCGGSNPSSPANRRRLVLRRFFYFARRIHAFLRRRPILSCAVGPFRMRRRRKLSPTAHSFLSCQKRMGRKEALGYEIALTRLKKHFASAYHSPIALPARNALRAAVGSGFPIARYTVRVASFAPAEYLTYGSRKAVLFTRAAMHIAHKRTSTQGTSETDAEYFDYNADLSNTHLHRVL